jgi:hypothetical protein
MNCVLLPMRKIADLQDPSNPWTNSAKCRYCPWEESSNLLPIRVTSVELSGISSSSRSDGLDEGSSGKLVHCP